MKFGKHLQRVRDSSCPEWQTAWLDYKMLKRLIKAAALPSADSSSRAGRAATAQDLASIPEERAFFSALLLNLSKVSSFYTRRVAAFRAALLDLQALVQSESVPSVHTLAACRNLYTDMLLLENYVITNYCGFSKILKKHDKNTGWETREKYMRRMVNAMAFAHYPELRALVEEVECMFQQLAQLRPHTEGARPALGGEEQQALSALRELRAETQHLLPEEEDCRAAAAVAAACQGRPEEELIAITALASAGRLVDRGSTTSAHDGAIKPAGSQAPAGLPASMATWAVTPAGRADSVQPGRGRAAPVSLAPPATRAMGPPAPVIRGMPTGRRRRRGSSAGSTSSEGSDEDHHKAVEAEPLAAAPAARTDDVREDHAPNAKRSRVSTVGASQPRCSVIPSR